ncbi:hypothetical protein EXIGLDRAFT_623241, partial [Exidia glandulosa HHB12029]
MNPAVPPPPSIDNVLRDLNALRASQIPAITVDETPEQFFDAPITQADVQLLREHQESHSAGETPGYDLLLDGDVQSIEDSAITELANACFEKHNLRTIGAESKLLKSMTLLALFRVTRWVESRGILPPSQNGFRKGYRTINNVFILRCLIDKARSQGKPLYVSTVDISNAFPSTDRATLWLKLQKLGMKGKIFD